MKTTHVCAYCGKEFESNLSPAHRRDHPPKYCSRKCSSLGLSQKVEVQCVVCGKTLLRKRYRTQEKQRGHFCGFECYGRWQSENMRGQQNPAWVPPVLLECEYCQKPFQVPPHQSHRRFCSRECFQDFAKVDYPQPASCYNSCWEAQRKKALERDHNQCRYCSEKTRLLVHHVRPLRDLLAEAVQRAHELDNLETVCEGCHSRLHNQLSQSRIPNPSTAE